MRDVDVASTRGYIYNKRQIWPESFIFGHGQYILVRLIGISISVEDSPRILRVETSGEKDIHVFVHTSPDPQGDECLFTLSLSSSPPQPGHLLFEVFPFLVTPFPSSPSLFAVLAHFFHLSLPSLPASEAQASFISPNYCCQRPLSVTSHAFKPGLEPLY
jgi:hypothetical protein